MWRQKTGLAVGMMVGLLLAATTRWPIQAQTPSSGTAKSTAARVVDLRAVPGGSAKTSVAVALTQPLRLPFREPTSLQDVASYLQKSLEAPVVLDVAALNRLEISPESTVRLELDGVRLQTGLKLLLDQLELTYRLVPEDNLLIFTDQQGTTDPAERALGELKVLHREIHELQDAVDDIYDRVAPGAKGPSTRNPTIIEEVPEAKTKPPEPARSRPG